MALRRIAPTSGGLGVNRLGYLTEGNKYAAIGSGSLACSQVLRRDNGGPQA
jgi:hypothetical protein